MSVVQNIKDKLLGNTAENTSDLAISETLPNLTPGTEKRGRGRPAKNESGSVGTPKRESAKVSDELDKLFSPENFRALVRAPADIRLAVTGRKHWELKDSEVESLAITASTTAKYFAVVDPKWLAVAMFATNAAMIYGSRIVEDMRQDRKNENK